MFHISGVMDFKSAGKKMERFSGGGGGGGGERCWNLASDGGEET